MSGIVLCEVSQFESFMTHVYQLLFTFLLFTHNSLIQTFNPVNLNENKYAKACNTNKLGLLNHKNRHLSA
jgi:hypothetical protein